MSRYRYQCNGRGAPADSRCCYSFRLRKPLEAYPPAWRRKFERCLLCGRSVSLRRSGPRTRYRNRKCWCDGYDFPHRFGSGTCAHNPAATEEDIRDWVDARLRRWRFGQA